MRLARSINASPNTPRHPRKCNRTSAPTTWGDKASFRSLIRSYSKLEDASCDQKRRSGTPATTRVEHLQQRRSICNAYLVPKSDFMQHVFLWLVFRNHHLSIQNVRGNLYLLTLILAEATIYQRSLDSLNSFNDCILRYCKLYVKIT